MARPELDAHFLKVELLAQEMQTYAPLSNLAATSFRANLAGLLVVTICATYETCVKEILINFADSKHADFGRYATNNYAKLSSKIAIADLHKYAKLFDPNLNDRFKQALRKKRDRINSRLGKDILQAYEQLLNWRHDFAHAGSHNTTIEEALTFHRLAKRIIYVLDTSFSLPELTPLDGL